MQKYYDDSVRIEAANNISNITADDQTWLEEGNISSDSEKKGKMTPMISYHKQRLEEPQKRLLSDVKEQGL